MSTNKQWTNSKYSHTRGQTPLKGTVELALLITQHKRLNPFNKDSGGHTPLNSTQEVIPL